MCGIVVFVFGWRHQLKNRHIGFACGFVVPCFVTHDDLEQLFHGLFHLARSDQQTRFGKAGVEIAFVFLDQRIELLEGPAAAFIGGDKLQGLQPVVERIKTQLQWNFGELGRKRGLCFF